MDEELFAPKIPLNRDVSDKEMKKKTWLRAQPIQVCYNVENQQPIPLKFVNYHIKVMNGLYVVEVEQVYSTIENTNPIELEYLFTIQSNAAVTKMIVELGDVIVHGVVKEKEEAKQEYKQGIQDGKTMAYCDQDNQFPEIKRVKLGSLSPNKNLKIKFEYIQPLEVFLNKFWKLEVPPMIDPSYAELNQENVTHYRLCKAIRKYVNIQALISNFWQDVKVLIDVGQPITYLKSPTHLIDKINLEEQGKTSTPRKIQVVLQNHQSNFCANKSFTLLFSTENINNPNAILSHTNNDALQNEKYCATLTFIPKFNEVPLDDAYQQYVDGLTNTDFQDKANYLFFIDRSGSMAGKGIRQAKQSLILFLKSLPQECSFNIISFGTRHKLMWKNSKPYNQENLNDAIEQVEEMSADMIGTEIYKPLNEVYTNQHEGMVNVFLLTDGEVDAKPLIKLVSDNKRPDIRLYTVGLGGECSQYLIKRLAQITNGKYQFVNDNDNLNEKIIDLLEDAMSQTLQNFTLETDITNVQKIVPDPLSIVSLKKNQELAFQVLFSSEQPQFYIKIGCFDPQNKKQIQYQVNLELKNSQENDYFHRLAAHNVISHYEQSVQNGERQIQGFKTNKPEINDQDIINISIQHQILCSKTAFICEVCAVEDQFKPQKSQKIIVNTIKNFEQNDQSTPYYFQALNVGSLAITSCARGASGARGGRGGGGNFGCKSKTKVSQNLQKKCKKSKADVNDRSRSRSRSRGIELFDDSDIDSVSSEQEKCIQVDKVKPQKQNIEFDDIVKDFNADGSFHPSKPVMKQLQFDKMTNSEKMQEILWHTILALFYLEIYFQGKRKEWQLLYGKSVRFLQSNGICYQNKKNDYLSKYKDVIKE